MLFSTGIFSLFFLAALIVSVSAQTSEDSHALSSATTREHLEHEDWWPTKQFADRSRFAGTEACAGCHGGIARAQAATQMALTMMPASSSPVLAALSGEVFTFGAYHYTVARNVSAFTLKVSDGTLERDEPLQWAFGSGALAQSYEWWKDGQLYESRFNYFATLRAFDRTPGRLQGAPVSLDMAEGRKIADFEARKCFACHTTALTTTEPLSAAQFHPGVTCEACHGPGREHIAAAKAAAGEDPRIVNPAHMVPVQSVDFCGACHGTPRDVGLMGSVGKVTVRFPGYRLEKSHCWGTSGDARLTCFACHDPHRPLERDSASYDAACLRCHANRASASKTASTRDHLITGARAQRIAKGDARQPPCPVATARCTSCHMPKFGMVGMHYQFTDHNIRVVKPNAPFPD